MSVSRDCSNGVYPLRVAVLPRRPRGGQLLIHYTCTLVAGCVGPNAAGKSAAARAQSPAVDNECGLPMGAVAGLNPWALRKRTESVATQTLFFCGEPFCRL